jgi:hypothetical protein
MRVSQGRFDNLKDLFKDVSEIIARQLVLVAGINNLLKRGGHDSFLKLPPKTNGTASYTPKNLAEFADLDFGRKQAFIDDPWYVIADEAVNNRLRNAIAHVKADYDDITQSVRHYLNKEGSERASPKLSRSWISYLVTERVPRDAPAAPLRKMPLLLSLPHSEAGCFREVLRSLAHPRCIITPREKLGWIERIGIFYGMGYGGAFAQDHSQLVDLRFMAISFRHGVSLQLCAAHPQLPVTLLRGFCQGSAEFDGTGALQEAAAGPRRARQCHDEFCLVLCRISGDDPFADIDSDDFLRNLLSWPANTTKQLVIDQSDTNGSLTSSVVLVRPAYRWENATLKASPWQ